MLVMWSKKNFAADRQAAFMTLRALQKARGASGFMDAVDISIWSAIANCKYKNNLLDQVSKPHVMK
jgi:hypothetical protein